VRHKGIWELVLLLGLLLGPAFAVAAQTADDSRDSQVSLDFNNIELADLVQTISEMTGRNFVYDDTLKGTATIISPETMTLDEAYHLFLTVLNVKGFTVVPSGKVYKIVRTREASENNLPLVTGGLGRAGEQFVTRTVRLRYADAESLAGNVLKPLVPKTSNIAVYAPANTLIISDSASNIRRLLKIIAELDNRNPLDRLEIIPLQYANADEIAEICGDVISRSGGGSGGGSKGTRTARAGTGSRETSRILPYSRTNSLVVIATEEDLQMLRPLIARLDRLPSRDRAHINVYYLENADAETLAKTLKEIVTDGKQSSGAGGTGTPLSGRGVSITADKPTNALIINATPEDFELLKNIVAQLDIKRKQVYVEALIMELSMSATKALGASLQGAIATGSDSALYLSTNLNGGSTSLSDFASSDDDGGMASILGKAVNGILLGGFFSPISVTGADGSTISVPALSALIELSKTDSELNILSAPRLLTSDNEEAEIVVGSNVPIITERLTDSTSSDSLAQSVTVERKDVALTLRFTPQITEGDLVRLNIYQEITDISSTQIGDVDQVGPTLTKRLLRNTVLVENNRTVVLGGLIGDNSEEKITKVPGLGDIPLLGWLFKQKSSTRQKTNLLVFITPHILKDSRDLSRVTRRSRLAMEQFQPQGKQLLIPPALFDAPELRLDDEAPPAAPAAP
jgi:general secretion pathway protein D